MRPRYVLASPLLLALTGCAALFGSKQKDFNLNSSPPGAEVYLNGNRLGATPVRVKLSNLAEHTFVFRREGYREATCTLSRGTDGGWVVLDILAGLVPVIIDAATNSWSQTKGDGCAQALEPLSATASPTATAPPPAPAPVLQDAPKPVPATPLPSARLVDDGPPGTNWVADAKTKTYYAAGCPATANIPAADRLYYGAESSLQTAGFTKAEEC